MKLLTLSYCFLVTSLLSTPGWASIDENFRWHGFVAQGLIQSKGANFVNENGNLSFELTEVGLNGAYQINSHLRVAGQGVYLNGGNRYLKGARIDYLFLDWSLVNTANWQLDVHLGRNKNTHWLYSATRDVPHTRPSIILPQSVYNDVFRDMIVGKDGISVHSAYQHTLGEWELGLSYGKSPIPTKQSATFLGAGARGTIKHDFEQQVTITYRPPIKQFQLGTTLMQSEFNYRPEVNDAFLVGSTAVKRAMLQFSYFSEYWVVDMELLREQVDVVGLFHPQFTKRMTAEGGYLQGRYFLSPEITVLGRIDIFDRDNNDRRGEKLSALSQQRIPPYFAFMDQATIGLSWDFSPKWRVNAEFHRVKGTARLGLVLVPDTANNRRKYWNVVALQIMHWF